MPYLALFFKKNGFSGFQIGLILALVPLCKFVFTSKWTKLFGSSSMPRLFAASSVFLANIALYFLVLFPTFFTAALIVIVFSVLRVGLLPAVDHCSMEFFKKSGIEYGKMRMFGSIGFIASTVIMGKIVDILGVDSIVVAASVLGCLSAVPLIFLQLSNGFGKKHRKKGTEVFPTFFYFILVAVIFYFVSFSFPATFAVLTSRRPDGNRQKQNRVKDLSDITQPSPR